MDVQVLQVRIVGKGVRIAHVKAGDMFGDVPARDGVQAGQSAVLKNILRVRDGRLVAALYVEPLQG
jgi:hypothetical protein